MAKWINKKGWLKGYVQPKEVQPAKDNSSETDSATYGVIYYPIKCPKCGSKDNKCYKSMPPVRYHKCNNCGFSFKSREAGV